MSVFSDGQAPLIYAVIHLFCDTAHLRVLEEPLVIDNSCEEFY